MTTTERLRPLKRIVSDPERRRTVIISILGVVLGVGIVQLASKGMLWHALEHVGHGIIVASIVGAFWHVPEMTDFFARFAREVMLEHSYLKDLGSPRLHKLRATIAEGIVQPHVDYPLHEWLSFHTWMEELTFNKCLPAEAPADAGVYRRGYDEIVSMRFTTLGEVLAKLGLDVDSRSVPQDRVVEVETRTMYDLIAPRKVAQHPVSFSLLNTDLPAIPLDKQLRCWIGTKETDAVPIAVKAVDVAEGGTSIVATRTLELPSGVTRVFLKAIHYQSATWSTFHMSLADRLTYGLTVHLTILGEDGLRFDGHVIGLGGRPEPVHVPNGLRLSYPGWLLEDQGYVVYWWR